MRQIYETGQGSVKLRARYVYDENENCIEIIQIPYSTTIELIMNRISDMVKEGELAPVEYAAQSIRDMIISTRKQKLIMDLEQDLLKDARDNGKFVIY